MVNCIQCNIPMDVWDPTTTVIAGDAYCGPCLYGETVPWFPERNNVGPCNRCRREETLDKFSHLCNDCADDMSS